MSVILDDRATTQITSANGVNLLIDTTFVPWPLGSNYYETSVTRCDENGNVRRWKPIDEEATHDKKQADVIHAKMINRWMKGVVI